MNTTTINSNSAIGRQADRRLPNRGLLIAMCATLLCGCAGTKLMKEPLPLEARPALAGACDTRVCVDVDWIIVRDGPGAWAAKANWDEYLLQVRSQSGEPVHIRGIAVYDSTDHRVEPATNRADLVKGSKKTVRRYKGSDVKVEAGMGAGTLVATGSAITAGGVGAAFAAAAASPMGAGGGVALGLGVAVVGPVLIVNGVVRAVNNGKVDDEIQRRQSSLPAELAGHGSLALDLFLPFAPSPSRVEISYESEAGAHVLSLDTRDTLAGLHLESKYAH